MVVPWHGRFGLIGASNMAFETKMKNLPFQGSGLTYQNSHKYNGQPMVVGVCGYEKLT